MNFSQIIYIPGTICKLILIIFLNAFFSCGALNTQNEYSLKDWPKGKTPEEIGRRISDNFLTAPFAAIYRGDTVKRNKIHYASVCAWLGGLWFAEQIKDENLFSRFEENFGLMLDTKKSLSPPPNHVDNNVFGAVPLELYVQTKKEKYLNLGLYYADSQWIVPENASAAKTAYAEKDYSWQTRLWVDDMFMITILQVQAYRATGNEKYLNRAARQMTLYLNKLQLQNGLFYHHPKTPFFWGRGNGWFAVGMAEILRFLTESSEERAIIMESYQKMMNTLLYYQESDGMWRQIIDDTESWKETSCTAMFTYAFITGVKEGWLDAEEFGAAARRGWLGVTSYINEDDELTEVCQGTGRGDRQHYLNRKRQTGDLHGHAPLLWCAAALHR